MIESLIKINFVYGLGKIVSNEIKNHLEVTPITVDTDRLYLAPTSPLERILELKTITNVFLVKRSKKINPRYLSNHKSVLMELVQRVIDFNKSHIKNFRISCAGNHTAEVDSIKQYIKEQYKILESEIDPDLKIYIGKNDDTWEAGVELTTRPLSSRSYKVGHVKGGINPTVAYAMNTLCNLPKFKSYLNVFSGSATLLIEATTINPDMKFVGFDNHKKHISTAIQNLKQAKLLTKIELKFLDIFDNPDLGKFDVITSDLPFGMNISKGEDLEKLYQAFINFCEKTLNPNGVLVMYTTESNILEEFLEKSTFVTQETFELKIHTNADAFIHPRIYVCQKA